VSGMVLCWCEMCLWWACLSTTIVLTSHSCMLWVCCLQVYSTPCAFWLPDSKMPIHSSVWIMDPFSRVGYLLEVMPSDSRI
jgi:hypothetical protein